MMEFASARAALSDLKGRVHGLGAALLGRDGRVECADLPEGAYAETFGIMCATAFGAAVAANSELGRAAPHRVVLEGDGSRTVMVPLADRALLVIVVTPDQDLPRLLRETEKFADLFAGRPHRS